MLLPTVTAMLPQMEKRASRQRLRARPPRTETPKWLENRRLHRRLDLKGERLAPREDVRPDPGTGAHDVLSDKFSLALARQDRKYLTRLAK
jgi:hypothetical protein